MLNLRDEKVIVTGGAGLIGSFLVDRLVNDGAHVIVVDDFSKGKKSNLKNSINDIEIREGNLENFSFVKKALFGSKIIFHLASRAYGIGYSQNNHLMSLIHNERITTNLLEYFTKKPPERLLITSSSCVYSDHGPDIIAEDFVIDGKPEIANFGYGLSKIYLEEKFKLLAETKKFKLSVVRPFNIYGERYNWVGENSQAIPMLVKKILDKNNPIIVWGSGEQCRTYLHADDCARIMKIILQNEFTEGPVNIGLDKTISIKELVNLICKVNKIYPKIKFDKTKPEGRFIKGSDTSKLKNILCKHKISETNLEDGLKKMSQWYYENFRK